MSCILFLHGLNTYGDDDLHLGPLRFGPMHARLQLALEAERIRLVAISGLTTFEPAEQAAEIGELLARDSSMMSDLPEKFHVLGQSTGGLTARALVAQPALKDRIASLMTLGTPHAGAEAASLGLRFARSAPGWQKAFSIFGYDTLKKLEIFSSFTPESVANFNRLYPPPGAKTTCVSFICHTARDQTSWPLRLLESRLNPSGNPGDGFISVESQRFGVTKGPFALDHFGEIGFFPFLNPHAKARATQEFLRLVREIALTARGHQYD